MDGLDLLENFSSIFFAVLPLIGIGIRNQTVGIVFSNTEYGLSREQKLEIHRRFEFVALLLAIAVTSQALVLTILAYHHLKFMAVFAAITIMYLCLGLFIVVLNLGPTKLNKIGQVQFLILCIPLLLIATRIVIIYFSVGIEIPLDESIVEPLGTTS